MIPMLLQLFGPAISGILTSLVERAMTHGKTTVQALPVAAGVVGLLEYMGCDMSLGQEAVIGVTAALPLVFSVDPDKIAPTLLEAAKASIDQKKKSQAVLKAAEAEQAAWAKPKE